MLKFEGLITKGKRGSEKPTISSGDDDTQTGSRARSLNEFPLSFVRTVNTLDVTNRLARLFALDLIPKVVICVLIFILFILFFMSILLS